ncbi:MAG: hypothetical protein K1000chlam3_00093 [Chlamydiae bacterium]|nr:hypothetical protein [Chlamydiota bacterium]
MKLKTLLSIFFISISALNAEENLKEIPPELYALRVDVNPDVVYEVVSTQEGLGWSLAVIDVMDSPAHYHREFVETYTVMSGELELIVDDETIILQPGESYTIPTGAIHSAKSLLETPTRIIASCVPGWNIEDHNLVE